MFQHQLQRLSSDQQSHSYLPIHFSHWTDPQQRPSTFPQGQQSLTMNIKDLPSELNPEVVLEAIAKFDEGITHSFGPSTTYDLIHAGKRYPPKAIAGLAWSEVLGMEVTPDTFDGGAGSKCFRVLRKSGFRVVPKVIPFMVGHTYHCKDLRLILGVDEDTTKGDWATGYHFHQDITAGIDGWWFLFPNVGSAGRSGHDYVNNWEADNLLRWQSIPSAKLSHPNMQKLVSGKFPVLLFTQEEDQKPFTYHGTAHAENIEDTSPVNLTWRVDPGIAHQVIEQPLTVEEEFVSRVEGKPTMRHVTTYERVPQNRKDAIKYHGLECAVCGFDFQKAYGELGSDFIHVHHIVPVSDMEEEKSVNPQTDLIPVCPNCHAMIHRKRSSTLSIDDLKELVDFRITYQESE